MMDTKCANQAVSFPKFYKQANAQLKSAIMPVGRLIGFGKHSIVYKGMMVGSSRSVTIKLDERPIQKTEGAEAAFQEIQAQVQRLKKLNHPGIAQLVDWIPDWERNRSYIIMQYIEGKSLNQILADKGPLSQAQTLNYALQLLDAMDYLHGKRYVIGDLDSSNVVRTPEERVCLVDFRYMTDISRVLRQDETEQDGKKNETKQGGEADATKERTDEANENPDEDVPDMRELHGNEDVNRPEKGFFGRYDDNDALQAKIREDIFHLGATLYEFLTGYDPELHKAKSQRKKEWPKKPPTLEERREALEKNGVSKAVADVILKALWPEAEKRYASAGAMREALQELPVKDSHAISQGVSLALGAAFTLIMLAIGLFSVYKGQYQVGRYAQMTANAGAAATALEEDNYTEAIAKALESVRSEGNDPPPPPEGQAVLAKTVSAYDYVSGYKPYRSDFPLRGRPLRACFSPEGDRIAVLVEDATAYPSAKRIQFFDAQSGAELCAPLTVSYAEQSDFIFLNNDALLYAGESAVMAYDLSRQESLPAGPGDSSDKKFPVSLAVSGDGKTAVSAYWGESGYVAYLYQTEAILDGAEKRYERLSLTAQATSEQGTQTAAFQTASMSAEMDALLALNQDGRYLAVSFLDGGLGIYDLPETKYHSLIPNSNYVHFEGGFYGGYFFYAASTAISQKTTLVEASGALISLESMTPALLLSRNAQIHIQADEYGVYLSVGDWLYRADTQYFRWGRLAQADGTVRLLRHAAGRLLTVTENELALVYQENGAWKRKIADGSFTIADLSEQYVFLANSSKTMLSALKWREPDKEILTYGDEAQSYEHFAAHVYADGNTVMIFRSTGFRIYDTATGNRVDADKDKDETSFPCEAEVLIYQRKKPPDADAPEQECLKVVYADRTEFYSAKTGELLQQRERTEGDADPLFVTASFRVCQNSGGSVKIYAATSDKLLKLLPNDKLAYASEYGGFLIVSLLRDGKEPYSFMLDKNLACPKKSVK